MGVWGLMLWWIMAASMSVQSIVAPPTGAPVLFDGRADSLFDIWCPAHVIFGIILAGGFELIMRVVSRRGKPRSKKPPPWWSVWFLCVMSFVVGWELFEFAGEVGLLGLWFKGWLNGYEYWFNRYFLDPLLAVIGCAIWRRWPVCFWPVTVIGIIYEAASLAAPTAMSIQNWLFGM
jgi:hypothetical protein